jgi:hypothetical protein
VKKCSQTAKNKEELESAVKEAKVITGPFNQGMTMMLRMMITIINKLEYLIGVCEE